MLRTVYLIAALTAVHAPRPARADYSAYTCRTTGPAKAMVENNACVGYTEGKTKVSFSYRGSGHMLSSADGRTVAMVQTYLYGRIDAQREVTGFDGDVKNPKALYVYRDGQLVASHRIHDLVKRRRLIWPSVSHVRWTRAETMFADGTLQLTTMGFRRLVFDAKTGALITTADAEDWRTCAVIAGGKLDRPAKKLHKPFYYKKAHRGRQPLSFIWGKRAWPTRLTNKAHTVGCFVRAGGKLVFARQLAF